ncbi:MAG: hypothetical protein V7709_14135, partial [Halioglobus sp.]
STNYRAVLRLRVPDTVSWHMIRRKRFCQRYPTQWVFCLSFFLGASAPVLAQDVGNRELGSGYAHMVSFAAEPEVAAATFNIGSEDEGGDDQELETLKVPLYREFDSPSHNWSWFAQGALSYLSYKQKLDLFQDGSVRFKWEGFSGLLESGIKMPLGGGFSLAPSLGVGISRLENSVRFSTDDLEDRLDLDGDGSIFNWDSLASIARAHIALLYDEKLGNYRFKGGAHLSFSNIDSFNESRDFPGFSDSASTMILNLDVSHPLNVEVGQRPLYIIGHLGNTTLLGSGRDVLGFDSFSEVGASLGYAKLALGVMAIFGDNVDGWTLIFNYDY